jgi:hypothetical protein
MSDNSLVDEIRAEREAYAARFNYDLWAIYRDLKEQERKSGRTYLSLVAKRRLPDRGGTVEADVRQARSGAISDVSLHHR